MVNQEGPRFSRRELPKHLMKKALPTKGDVFCAAVGTYATIQTLGMALDHDGLVDPHDAAHSAISIAGYNGINVSLLGMIGTHLTYIASKNPDIATLIPEKTRRDVASTALKATLATVTISAIPSAVFSAAENTKRAIKNYKK